MSAREALIGALDAAYRAGTPAPCAPTPDAAGAAEWDRIPHSGAGKANAIRVRRAACFTCPALDACDALRRDDLARGLKPFGVMAGHVYGVQDGGPGRPKHGAFTHPPEFRATVVAAYKAGATTAEISETFDVKPDTARRWIKQAGAYRTRAEGQALRQAKLKAKQEDAS